MKYSKAQQSRVDKGLCAKCGEPTDHTVYCSKCTRVCTEYNRQRRAKRRELGICYTCGNSTENNRAYCPECLKKARKYRTAYKLKAPYGVCVICRVESCLPSLVDATLYRRICQNCYLKNASCSQLGSVEYWKQLLCKLEAQQFRCVYSGDELILGVNDSMDHIYPKSRYPDKALDPSNIQWVTRTVNMAKGCLDHDEFLTLIRRINNRFPKD
ncbi:hypothetical protein LCGC14_0142800 [marine sediment metagenome]|uniref:Uncharacterized protein n=1 Tax=marine sediment metagenome TaxID=412755 RepID=A0A0F9V1B0_9ZZZZ